ncbi:3-oxoacyl-ACP reductase [Brucella endophytica]|uniref:3-oxoacyl-ACP reductase n=1 Tax=Brucella endophytica TaxID=1963359 RepID=A0A916WCW9_9HYPH|nr:SDR family oxidoreductase [Brucella endophytica]GGA86592.1 3-oxoacyl-ACP reductase [Brucella endophytica]
MARMDDKVALVVGGAKGIGLAIAERLASEGATVFLTGRRADEVEEAAAKVGHGARGLVADASVPDDVVRAVATIRDLHGRIDALALNAGISEPAALGDTTPEHFDRHFSVNVRGPVFAMQAALGTLSEGASVVLVGSIAGIIGVPERGAYSATKAALRSYARTWTAELSPRGIRVNVVSPGPTDTAMMAATSEEFRNAIIAQIPLRRMARPEEIAAAAVFLLSGDASYIAGTELYVDGGVAQI